ncbi:MULTISPECIES: patatin-like phospholipase family protein [Shimia]|uniref:patatin-like phospholipase family protein n=1 Tax=Shimia TaxID=573139 RepID=UPI001FB429DB|nr:MULTISPECIES: patatin-like phospholipase family protein [Shimia]MDV4144956.1 patatin-like phospholipase family protein [Shimia sp. FJ5]
MLRPILALCLSAVFALSGCAALYDRSAVVPPADRYEEFQPVGFDRPIRMYDDARGEDLEALLGSYRDWAAHWPGSRRGLDILALSGGGQYGAFGAGVLAGWTEAGTRPRFDMVTGVSTGALIAPFAFLGPDYDDRLKRFYTQTSTKDILSINIAGLFGGRGAVASTAPLAAAIERELDADLIRAIAREARSGRSLLIGTTNIDAERPVIWDIGAMAQVDTPEAHAMIRRVLLASAAIPIAFEPVRIPVTDGTLLREELHVDGGLTRQIFVYPGNLDMRRLLREMGASGKRNEIWLLQNQRIKRRFEAQSVGIARMGKRTYDLLLQSQSIGDEDFILSLAARDGFNAHTLAIPARFDAEPEEVFDPEFMGKLFDLGFEIGKSGDQWNRNAQRRFK